MSDLVNWNAEIQEIDDFLADNVLPDNVRLNAWTMIGSGKKYMEANLEPAREQNGNPTYRPYLDRAIEFMTWVKDHMGYWKNEKKIIPK